jgi:glycerol kinase
MATKKYVMAFDSGTTGIRAILFDRTGTIVGDSSQEHPQIYPRPGWVEHDPAEIWGRQVAVAGAAMAAARAAPEEIAGIGITNQRGTSIVWDRTTGQPVMNAIVWQDRRTSEFCDGLKAQGLEDYVRKTTGLVIDAYFDAPKIRWILDNVPGAREKAERRDLLFGSPDTWLIWNLTGGAVHVTDVSNASRTLLYDINRCAWDDRLLAAFGVPRSMLPEVRGSSEVYGTTTPTTAFGGGIPVAATIGDQQAALFGQACFGAGMVKATYGTGGSLLMNTGERPVPSSTGLLTTIGWGLGGTVTYALEGLVYIMGASVQWLRDELRIIESAAETEAAALSVPDTAGVYVVPAFTGFGAPHWDQYARGAILGLTRGANRNHVIRATLESMAYQIRDVIGGMTSDSGIPTSEIRVDGGAVRNDFLMQFQADILGVPVLRPRVIESTARGAAFLAGLATGFWRDQDELVDSFQLDRRFDPAMDVATRDELYEGWERAVGRALDWIKH